MQPHSAAAMAVLLVAATTGCGVQTPALPPEPSPTGVVAEQCRRAIAALPATLMGQPRSWQGGAMAAYEGGLSVRCGLDKPAALQPTSRCDVVNGIGWFAEQPEEGKAGPWRFTTIGRSTHLEVVVPYQFQPAVDALVEVTPAARALPEIKPCV